MTYKKWETIFLHEFSSQRAITQQKITRLEQHLNLICDLTQSNNALNINCVSARKKCHKLISWIEGWTECKPKDEDKELITMKITRNIRNDPTV